MKIFKCDGTFEGILTAVFDAYKISSNEEIMIETDTLSNIALFGDVIEVITDTVKSTRVANGLRRISEQAYYYTYLAAISYDNDRGTSIFYFIKRCFEIGEEAINDLHNLHISHMLNMYRNAEKEFWHYRGFLRFIKYNDFLLGRYEANNDIMDLLADFFSDRLKQEHFVIVDMKRGKAAVHKAYTDYFITDFDVNVIKRLTISESERLIMDTFETFKNTIGIEGRRNEKLQQQMMPLRFRKYM